MVKAEPFSDNKSHVKQLSNEKQEFRFYVNCKVRVYELSTNITHAALPE